MSKSMVVVLICAFVAGFFMAHLINNIWGGRLMFRVNGDKSPEPFITLYSAAGILEPGNYVIVKKDKGWNLIPLSQALDEMGKKQKEVILEEGSAIGDREIPGMPMGRKPRGWGEGK